jgi:hypothetical protein
LIGHKLFRQAFFLHPVVTTIAFALFLGACASTSYGTFDESGSAPVTSERRVTYEVNDAYYREQFRCVAITSSANPRLGSIASDIEGGIARYARTYFDSVIGADETRRLERGLGVMLDNPDDRRWFANYQECESLIVWRLVTFSSTYVVVWSEQQVGLDLELVRARDGLILWRALHVARRSDGGLPLSVLGAPVAAFQAKRFLEDRDVVPSVIDDVLRRTFLTLPIIS